MEGDRAMTTLTLRPVRRFPFADFDELFRPFWSQPVRTGFTPAAEIAREGDDAVIKLELAGLDLERDVTVEVDRGALVVRGERRDERSDERDGQVLREVRYGSFRRAFALPEGVTGEDVTASYDAGILTVRVAGAYRGATARRIPVTSGGAPAVEGAAAE